MRTNDLFEMADLDALGLLDENEQAEFEQAFMAAPAAVRRQIRDQQQRAVEFEESLLPIVEPDAGLGARVIGAIAQARALAESAGTRSVVHRPGRVVPRVRPSRRVSPLWRATSIGLSIAVMVLGVFAIQLQQHNSRLNDAIFVSSLYDKVGPRHLNDTLFDKNTRRIILTATNDAPISFSANAVLLQNPDWQSARFIFTGLTGDSHKMKGTYELCLVDDQDNVIRSIQRFESDGRWDSFDVDVEALETGHLALFSSTDQGLGKMLMIARG